MVDKLGEKGFGFMTKCLSTKSNEMVPIKCFVNHLDTVDQARQEIAILDKLQCLDPNTCNTVK